MIKTLVAILALFGVSSTGLGVIITQPLTLQTQFVVGTHDGNLANASIPVEAAGAQAILDLALGQVSGPDKANTVFDYSGTILGATGVKDESGGGAIPAGWGYAMAKYDGPNAGYVLYALGGTATTIPVFPYNFWTTNQEQYALSHYTVFNPSTPPPPPPPPGVPEGGTGMALLGAVMAGMGLVRKLTK